MNESKILAVVRRFTEAPAEMFNGTLFVSTQDSAVATRIFFALCDEITSAISFGKCGDGTSYDFL